MGRLTVIIFMLLISVANYAQDEPEYRAEIGVGIGMAA